MAPSLPQVSATNLRELRLAPGSHPAEVLRVNDGDTFEARVQVWPGMQVTTKVRLRGIDAAEFSARCPEEYRLAVAARDALQQLLAEGGVSTGRRGCTRLRRFLHRRQAPSTCARRPGPWGQAGRAPGARRGARRGTGRAPAWARAQGPARRSLPHGACTYVPSYPDRRARGPQPHRALREPARRRHRPDPREHLPRPGAERAPRHGGGLHRHRHAEERGALSR